MPGAGASCARFSNCAKAFRSRPTIAARVTPISRLHEGAPLESCQATGDGGRIADAARRVRAADFVICGTGIDMDYAARPELRAFAGNIATWADRYTPPGGRAQRPRLGRFPYLADDYALHRARAGRDAVDLRHPSVRHRLHDELWPVGLVDQRDDDGRAEAGAWPDARPVPRRCRTALGLASRPMTCRRPWLRGQREHWRKCNDRSMRRRDEMAPKTPHETGAQLASF